MRAMFPRRKLTQNKMLILGAVGQQNQTYKSEIERLTGLDIRTVSITVHELRTRGLVEFQGHNILITEAGKTLVEEYTYQQEQKIRSYCSASS